MIGSFFCVYFYVSCFSLSVYVFFLCVSYLFMVYCFILSRCLGCFRYYVFKAQVYPFLYSAFTCSRVLGFLHNICMF